MRSFNWNIIYCCSNTWSIYGCLNLILNDYLSLLIFWPVTSLSTYTGFILMEYIKGKVKDSSLVPGEHAKFMDCCNLLEFTVEEIMRLRHVLALPKKVRQEGESKLHVLIMNVYLVVIWIFFFSYIFLVVIWFLVGVLV